jgi:hypothetical protein
MRYDFRRMSETSTLNEYARKGAAVRIVELQAEIVEIQQMFPDLGGTAGTRKRPRRRAGKPAARSALAALIEPAAPRRRRRRLSAAARKAISDAQKRRWAAVKAGKK